MLSEASTSAPVASAPLTEVKKEKVKRIWDRDLDYNIAQNLLKEKIVQSRAECLPDAEGGEDFLAPTRLAHYSTMLCQIRNGSRSSEAVDAMTVFMQTQNRSPQIRTRKRTPICICGHSKYNGRSPEKAHEFIETGVRGKCLSRNCTCPAYTVDPEAIDERLIVIPDEVLDSDIELYSKLKFGAGGFNDNSYGLFAKRHFSNSHSCRFSYITDLDRQGKTASFIAGITHHANPMEIATYIQKKQIEKFQRQMASGKPPEPEQVT
jgi:hypothetical protein